MAIKDRDGSQGMVEPTRREAKIGEAAADRSLTIARAIVEGELDTAEVAAFRRLSKSELDIIWAKVEGMYQRGRMTDSKIAAIAGVSVKTVQRAKQNPDFGDALAIVVERELRGNIDLYVSALNYIALTEKRFGAIKFGLEAAGFHKPTSRLESVNVNIEMDASGKMPTQIRLELVQRWHELGWTIEDFVNAWKQAGF